MDTENLKEEFNRLYLDLVTILPDLIAEATNRYYNPVKSTGKLKSPMTPESLDALKGIHKTLVDAVASITRTTPELLLKNLNAIHAGDAKIDPYDMVLFAEIDET